VNKRLGIEGLRDSGIVGFRPQWNFPGGALFHGVKIAKSIEQEQKLKRSEQKAGESEQ